MRFAFGLALLVTLIIAGGYWYQTTAAICPVPLSYRLGELDESFSLSEADAKEQLSTAEEQWERTVNRDLFVYDDSAQFTINFIFDERQEQTDAEARERRYLDGLLAENEELFEAVDVAKVEFDKLNSVYQKRAEAYEQRLEEYNTTVLNYNDRGGAPAEVYEELEAERRSLDAEATELSALVDELNSLASKINRLSAEGDKLVETYNKDVKDYNQSFGQSREFTQGDYQGDSINVYTFSSENELQAVLLHEFGHALGIDHVEASSSVMYYLLEDTGITPRFTADDLAAFYQICGSGQEWDHQIRKAIRYLLAMFN